MFARRRSKLQRPASRRAAFAAAATALFPAVATADPVSPLAAGQVLQVFVGLGVVLALIALAAWATRRLNTFRPHAGGHIRVIEGLSLGAREKLLLVQVDGRRVLLGMSPGRIEALHAFPEDEAGARFDDALAHATARDTDAAA